jgi:AraC family transcriptional regulator
MTQHSHQTAPTQFVDNHGSKYQYSALFVADVTRSPGIDCVPEPVARAFKAAIGQSPHQYVSAKRLERAKALLIRGDQEIRRSDLGQYCTRANFSCQANFTRAFRHATGQTPGQFRQSSG